MSATPSSGRHALVIGAGLAGAAVAHALALRGWRVTLLDAASGPAAAASALPVGMLSPHHTRSPTPLSRLTALGVPLTRAELQRLVAPGHGWCPTEVDNLDHDPGRHEAALVRPGALVRAWLAEATALGRLEARWGQLVSELTPHDAGGWTARGPQGEPLVSAPVAVVAAALGSRDLLKAAALPLRPVRGQMSLGDAAHADAPTADRPQRRDGVFVPAYRDAGLAAWPAGLWSVGSTFERGATDTAVRDSDHALNRERLQAIDARAAAAFDLTWAAGGVAGWAEVRCASLDRLPLVGAAPALAAGDPRAPLDAWPRARGLYLLTALGSRGLSLAAWCGQRLAEAIDGEPVQAPQDLWRALDPARFAWRARRRAG